MIPGSATAGTQAITALVTLATDALTGVQVLDGPPDGGGSLDPVAVNTRRWQLADGRMSGATACPSGHPYAGSNLYVSPNGKRHCRTCTRRASREWHRRRKAKRVVM